MSKKSKKDPSRVPRAEKRTRPGKPRYDIENPPKDPNDLSRFRHYVSPKLFAQGMREWGKGRTLTEWLDTLTPNQLTVYDWARKNLEKSEKPKKVK